MAETINMTTTARTYSVDGSHWYSTKGDPCYELPKKDGSGMKNPTLADARKLNLLPSVTTILKILDKPALNDWRVEQGVLAVLTTPRLKDETDDDFVHRVLHVERIQDQEGQKARDKGTEIHAALEAYFLGQGFDEALRPWIEPAAKAIMERGQLVTAEKILVGDAYAGKVDLIQECPECWWITDWKTSKTLPDPKKGAWFEHRVQAAAYAAAFARRLDKGGMIPEDTKPIRTCNVYISTVEVGNFVVCDHDPDWQKTFNMGFYPLMQVWALMNNYSPKQ